MHERGHVQQLDGRRGGDQPVVSATGTEEDEHRPQPLASGEQRAAGMTSQLEAVALRHLAETRLRALEHAREPRTSGGEHRAELGLSRVHVRLVPEWMAMMPPAVSTQRTSSSPAAAIRAPSSSARGKRRTLDGR
jgi:hypothetical protein